MSEKVYVRGPYVKQFTIRVGVIDIKLSTETK